MKRNDDGYTILEIAIGVVLLLILVFVLLNVMHH